MLINRDHASWIGATVAATVVAAVGYVGYVRVSPYGPSGGSWPGLAFGIAGTACMVAAGLLSARKRVLLWRIGSAQAWMKLHIWLGLLAVPLILFHAGFRLGGALTTSLMVLFAIVIVSGIVGLVLQQVVPATMTARVPLETVYGQIEHVSSGLAADAYEIVASVTGALDAAAEEQAQLAAEDAMQKAHGGYWKAVTRQRPAAQPLPGSTLLRDFYVSDIRPYLRHGARAGAAALPDFKPILIQAPDEWRAKVEKLRDLCEEVRQLSVQVRLHHVLHHWLFIHAPLSFALFVLMIFHIVYALQY